MARPPGSYYQFRLEHIGEYYSHTLFDGTDPHHQDDDHYRSSRRRLSSPRHHPHSIPDGAPSSPPHSFPHARSASPVPSSPPAPVPSPSYLESSSKPSQTLSEPTRKLLVLDLNGTLLLRSPRPPKSYRGQHQHHPAPRRVMPRPYLSALCAYLFAPQTRAWLDVMVWSSAQPHSVEDMVLHAFGRDRNQLIAIWARDTLGLAEDHYYRKVQTIKDLEKPWADLAPRPSSKLPTWTGHSAETTILLDDSHAKAALQPYNHLCVLEYTRGRRNADLAALQQHAHAASQDAKDTNVPPPPPRAVSPPDDDGHEQEKGSRKRKRKKKSMSPPAPQPAATGVNPPSELAMDETLLGVIGILHAARLQSNIAAWLRAGALLLLSEPEQQQQHGAMWCEDPSLVHAWACRGREAMEELQLEVEHGVVGP
ncbi:hypothetical protein BJV74DRAFT_984449 [Russula compacta]|nr:hypothetical protein BJV74DRAFT_984449 [Russula compacta]